MVIWDEPKTLSAKYTFCILLSYCKSSFMKHDVLHLEVEYKISSTNTTKKLVHLDMTTLPR